MISLPTDPVLTCEQSLDFEQEFFESDLEQEWQMMTRAGEGIGDALLRDVRELEPFPIVLGCWLSLAKDIMVEML